MKKNVFHLREIFSLFILSLFFISGIRAQDVVMPDLEGFKKEMNYPVYSPDDLWDYINGAAESYNSLGFSDLHIAEYKKGKKIIIKLEMYRHFNNNMAFGIYAMERAPTYDFNDLGVQGYSGADHINFFMNDFYVKISTHSKSKKAIQGMRDLAVLVDQQNGGDDAFPGTLDLFPAVGRRMNEEMYISENVLGHEFLGKAFKVNYMIGENSFAIYLFTEGGEESISGMADRYLSRLDLDSGTRAEGKVFFEDGYNGFIFLAWKNELMVLINGLDEKESELADRIIAHFID
ncbi:MAG TPA: DUF6599 family protein [Bacteroidales bacterium]|nr:DUF6599 family protein [Bacteroidales bacterium]